MLLYFTNNSRQKKILIETDYTEDVYDEIISFFQDYKISPHFLEITTTDTGCRVNWESQSEFFFVDDITEEEIADLKNLFSV